jgi:hypothetical protein
MMFQQQQLHKKIGLAVLTDTYCSDFSRKQAKNWHRPAVMLSPRIRHHV